MAGLSPTIGAPAKSTLPIDKLINPSGPGGLGTLPTTGANSSSSSSATDSSAITSQLGPDAFLKLLTTQLSNQDPLKPMDDTQSVAQLAQFSALQANVNLEASFTAFQSNFAVMQSAGLIGKHVTVVSSDSSGNSSTTKGTVQGIQVIDGKVNFTMTDAGGNVISDPSGKPQTFTTDQITGIG